MDEHEKQLPPSRSESPQPMRQRDRSPSVATESSSEGNRPSRRRDRRRSGRERQGNNLPLAQGADPSQAVGQVGQTAGQVGQTAGQVGQVLGQATGGGRSGKDTLKLRLDLNLDVDISIKAKVHGDITLSLLD